MEETSFFKNYANSFTHLSLDNVSGCKALPLESSFNKDNDQSSL